MDREDSGVVEVADRSTAPVDCMLHREACHDAPQALDPGIMIDPEEQIDDLLVCLL